MTPEVHQNVSLKSLNTFGIDAHAAMLAEINSPEELIALLQRPGMPHISKLILGGGSNVLFTEDFDGLVILNRIKGISTKDEGTDHVLVTAGSGVVWHELVLFTVLQGWGGLENLSLIPGTVGAAPIQNIGAYGVEIKDTFVSLEAMNLSNGALQTFNKEECRFGYRDSIFKGEAKGQFAILNVTFKLSKFPHLNTSYGAIEQELQKHGIDQPSVIDVSNAVIRIRSSKLPDPKLLGNAGSFFKNPEIEHGFYNELKAIHPDLVAYPAPHGKVKLAAGWLIEQCGWKGKQDGHVGMHNQQALVLVNHGGATGAELITHARKVQESVKEKFGVVLEMEVNIL
jgi:UDP-N-acetylmuramate dehydrogenase